MDPRRLFVCIGLFIAASAGMARAQAPFFGGGVAAFDPEIGVINSGVLLDAQATVTADRKNVMLNMRPTASRLQGFQRFPVNAVVNGGFVGGINLPSGTAVSRSAPADDSRPRGATAAAGPSPDEIARTAKAWVFTRQGMYRVAALP